MLVQFEKEYLAELYEKGKCSSKKYRFQPSVVKNYKKRIDTLIDAPNMEALYLMNSLNYEVLKDDKKGISSIRIDRKYRLEFEVSIHDSDEIIVTVCSVLDISKHYE